ncbi:GAF domain-containing protein [Psychrobacillus sp. INOP01]|uniref:GAF domain-containing protein n=1 Tax=Psychrobacillus sp. INOP01 TaxID=2829187 RepID=UPI001BAB69D7|nr:GAF domain-containing protein [Psychrobacillus sp. INOP01]QUG41504.1 GAF domain-containing protein [Psychrobacillus sp. INOP01]
MNNDLDFQEVITAIKDKYEVDLVTLAFIQPAQLEYVLTWQFAIGNINNRLKRIVLQSGKGVAGQVFKSGKPMLVRNVLTEFPSKDLFNYPIIVSEKIKSFCALPLYKKNKVQGVILLGYREENKMTNELFERIIYNIHKDFPKYYGKEMAKN